MEYQSLETSLVIILVSVIISYFILHEVVRSASRSTRILEELKEANRLKRLELEAKGIETKANEEQKVN